MCEWWKESDLGKFGALFLCLLLWELTYSSAQEKEAFFCSQLAFLEAIEVDRSWACSLPSYDTTESLSFLIERPFVLVLSAKSNALLKEPLLFFGSYALVTAGKIMGPSLPNMGYIESVLLYLYQSLEWELQFVSAPLTKDKIR